MHLLGKINKMQNLSLLLSLQSFDSLIKEKDVELQHLANTLKNLQRSTQEAEDNLNRSLREKDSIISQLQQSLEGKTKDMEVILKRQVNLTCTIFT